MADEQLTFFGWFRPPGHTFAASGSVTAGRLAASVDLTVSDTDNPNDKRTRQLGYDLLGPGDVTGLRTGAVVRTYPSAGSRAVETDKAVYAELAAPDLPWRYTLDRPRDKALNPWLVLIVGTVDEVDVKGETVRLQPSVLDAHPLATSARLAHVETDTSGHTVARLISPRALAAERAHVAVIVPAFGDAGAPAWPSPAARPVDLPAYYSWTFETKASGDFAAIARRLHLVEPDPDLGSTTVHYSPLPTSAPMPVAGALTATGPTAATRPLPRPVATDLRQLTRPRGSANHPILGLPDLAGSWPSDGTTPAAPGWRDALLADYRARAVAGLGERAGIIHQDLLADQAGRIAGAYQETADRLRRLAAGLLASRSLWTRRVPGDRMRRLAFLGPALRDVLTATGPVVEAMEHPERALDRTLFSSAAQRVLRPRATVATGGPPRPLAADVGDTLPAAAAAPPPPVRSVPRSLHTDAFARATRRPALDDVVAPRPPALTRLRDVTTSLVQNLDRRDLDLDTAGFVDAHLTRVVDALSANREVPIVPLLNLLDSGQRLTSHTARFLAAALDAPADAGDLAAVANLVARPPAQPVTTAFDVAAASDAIRPAFDPTLPRPAMTDRVLAGVLDDGEVLAVPPLGSMEMAPDLDLPAWQFVRDDEPEWLLPGAGDLDDDTVVALTTNPAFVDTFLLGLNAQVVGELRFRNYPLIPGWTPVRTFWDRANAATADTDDDIVAVDTWTTLSPFGHPSHQTPSASSADLVVLFNSSLFREYPGTVVSLVPVGRDNGAPDWDGEPDFDHRLLPSFLGQISPDRTFFGFDLDPLLGAVHWVVLEETVTGRRFLNARSAPAAATAARNGADLAKASVSPPRRVMIRGDILLAGAGT
jgi:hypothetical protein